MKKDIFLNGKIDLFQNGLLLEESNMKNLTTFIHSYSRKLKHLVYDFQLLLRLKYPCTFDKPKPIFRFTESIRKFITGWDRDLLWCPSQLNKHIVYNNKNYTLYARWRWDDPWTGYIIYNDYKNNKNLWSEELISDFNFKDYDIRKVERKMDSLFRQIIVHKDRAIRYK